MILMGANASYPANQSTSTLSTREPFPPNPEISAFCGWPLAPLVPRPVSGRAQITGAWEVPDRLEALVKKWGEKGI